MDPIYKLVFDPATAKKLVFTTVTAAKTAGGGGAITLPEGSGIIKQEGIWDWIKKNWKLVAVGSVAFIVLLKR